MCVIIYKPQGVDLPAEFHEMLEAGWKSNPDGAGVAFWKKRRWKVIKGLMKLEELYATVYENVDGSGMIIHLRHATHGGVTPLLTHPFPIQLRRGRAFLFHNGVFPIEVDSREVSDTLRFAMDLSLLRLDMHDLLTFLSTPTMSAVIDQSRLILVKENEPSVHMIGDFFEHEGLYFSSPIFPMVQEKCEDLISF